MKTKLIAIFSILIGFSVIGMWLMILKTQTPPEGKMELTFHLFSEFLMATVCIVGGFLQLLKAKYAKPMSIAALSMVIYSVLNATGYYGERGDNPMIVMFICLFLITFLSLIVLITNQKQKQ